MTTQSFLHNPTTSIAKKVVHSTFLSDGGTLIDSALCGV